MALLQARIDEKQRELKVAFNAIQTNMEHKFEKLKISWELDHLEKERQLQDDMNDMCVGNITSSGSTSLTCTIFLTRHILCRLF